MQGNLFDNPVSETFLFQNEQGACETFSLDGGGELVFYPCWLREATANLYFARLLQKVQWEQSVIQIHGKLLKIPRLNAWYGDANSRYQYSGAGFEPLPWTRELSILRRRLAQTSHETFNSALVNLYRDGHDSVAWHADNETELGPNPTIASISLGQERRFLLKPKRRQAGSRGGVVELLLPNGSLLFMRGSTQKHWQHAVPKTQKALGPRINITFRSVVSANS